MVNYTLKRTVRSEQEDDVPNQHGHLFKGGKCVHCLIKEEVLRYLGVRCRKSPQQYATLTGTQYL